MTEKTFAEKCEATGEAMQKAGKNMVGCGCLLIICTPGAIFLFGLVLTWFD